MPKATPGSRSQERAAADNSSVNRLPMLILALLLAVGTALFAAWGFPLPASAEGPESAPGAPETPTGTALHAGIVDVEWNEVEGADSYELQVFLGRDWIDLPGEGIQVSFYGAGAVVRKIQEEGRYTFRVRSRNAHGVSPWSGFKSMPATGVASQWEEVPFPENAPATGEPIVTGVPIVDETLTSDSSNIADENGLQRVKFHYQWVRTKTSTDSDIAGATTPLYVITEEDQGHEVKVRVSFTDRGGYKEAVTSQATGPVLSVHANICSRTGAVKTAILADPAVPTTDCTEVDLRWMRNITELNLEGESLDSIQAGDFTGLTGLRELDLSQNLITSLPTGVFDHLSSLQSLDLSDNNLESIPSDAFQELVSLDALGLSRTNLDSVPKDALEPLAGLERLDLSNNNVDSVPADAFEQLPRLASLDLSHNELESVPTEALNHLSSLASLHLGYNRISELTPATFDSLTTLTELTLGYNQLVSLPPGAFDKLTGLEALDLSHNGLRSLSADTFGQLTGLSRLNLEANHLTSLPALLLDQASGLVELRLGDNPLTGLPEGLLDPLGALTHLNMSDNALMPLRPGVFKPLNSLTHLDLSGVHYSPHLLADINYLQNLDGAAYSRPAVPGAPTGLTTVWRAGSRELAWNAPATGEAATSYRIMRKDGDEPWKVLVHDTFDLEPSSHHHGDHGEDEDEEEHEATETAQLTYTDTAVTGGETYRYRVRALSAGGTGPASGTAEAAVPVGVCQRTIQLEKALAKSLGISEDDCEALANADLASVTTLDLSGQSIGLLQEGDFEGLTGLTTLDLSANTLITLPRSMFSQLASVSSLDLRDNPDLSYSPYLLSLLTGLTTLDGAGYTAPEAPEGATGLSASQSHGNVILAWHPPGSGPEPGSYRILRAQGDGEMEIHVEDTFSHQGVHQDHGDDDHSAHGHDQETVSLTDTGTVPGKTYRYSVETLGAGGKGPESSQVEVTVESFSICGRTRQVRDAILKKLGYTDCANISYERMAAITVLGLSSSGIRSVQAGDFDGLESLEILDMCLTCLKTIGAGAFSNLKNLKTLEIYWSCLEDLPPDAFQGLESLETLKMYRNYRLESIPAGLFDGLTNLRTLRMDRTGLTTLPDGIFDDLTSLEWLAVGYQNRKGPAYSPYLISHLTSLSQLNYSAAPYTRPLAPPAPTGLTATHEDGSVKLHWTAPSGGTRAASYRVYRKAGNDTWEILVHDTWYQGRAAVTYTDSDVREGVTYLYSVSSLNAGGTGARSGNTRVTLPGNNYAPTGRPTITGTPRVEQRLRANTYGISDEDGLANVSYGYQWSAGGVDIAGATGSRYLLTLAEQGKTVQVTVTFTDDEGNEHTLASTATVAIQPAQETWQATLTVAARDGATGYSFSGQPVLGSLSPSELDWHGNTHYVRYIFLKNGELWLGLNEEMLSTGFVLSAGDEEFGSAEAVVDKYGASYRFRWDDPGLGWSEEDQMSVTLAESSQNTPALGRPAINGTPVEYGTLQADISEIRDADGTASAAFSYQWVSNDGNGNGDTDLEDGTAANYTVTGDDVGRTIRVRVSFLDDRDNEETLTSEPTAAVTAAPNRAPTGLPAISGTPKVQEILTATTSDISDEDGLANASFSYQWVAEGSDIDDATGSSYTMTPSEQGKRIRLRVTFTDDRATEETLTSESTDTVKAADNHAPAGLPAISGIAHTGQTLTADTSGITDADGLNSVLFTYQWIAGGSDIEGATGSTYTLTAREQGLSVLVRVSFTDDADNQESLTSAATAAVAARPNSPPTGAPTISGTAQSGETLTADVSGVADADGLTNVSFSYQWIRNDGNSDSDIPDATDTTYTLVSADEDKTIKVRVSFTDDADNQETLTSTTTVIVDQPGTVSLWPELPRVGTVVSATLTDPDGLEGAGSGAAASLGALSWQWSKSSEGSTWTSFDVGQDGNSYTPTGDDEGMWLKVTAVYTDGHGRGKSAEAITAATIGAREASPELTVTELATGLTHPWDIAFTPDGTMLFTERDDGLRVRLPDGTVRQVTADFSDLNFGGTAGLLALVLDPDFVSNRRFYTYQRHTGPEMQVIAWTIDQDYTAATRVADPLVGGIPVNRNRGPSHGGGRLRFGPQGYLWIATGDGFSGTAAQDLTSLGGKVLRVDSQTGAGAPGNPFAPSPVYTYGHRNPQGLALRPGTGQMWSVEHGPDHDDEINLLVSGGNYGWDPAPDEGVEGLYDETTTPMTDLLKFPDALQAKWSSGYPTLAVGGGVFLEGSQWREWEGQFAVATLKTKSVRVFKFTEEGDLVSQAVVPELDRKYGRLRSAVLGPDGALYITTTNGGGKDKILKVVPANTPATGAPTIGGTAQVGETLTVDTSAISDQDGLSSVSYSYQWIRNDGRSDTGLQDATASVYTPSVSDVGRTIKVQASFTDDEDNEETLTSEATAEVLAMVPTEPLRLTVAKGDKIEELDASWQAPSTNGGSAITGYKLQWKEAADSWDTAADVSEATVPGTTHTITGLTGGVEYAVRVIATNDVGDGLASTEAKGTPAGGVSEQNAEPENTEPTGLPTIGGTPRVGEMLAADTSGIADEDGLDDVSYSYQWVAGDTDIDGATGSSYVLTSSEQGKTIKVKVSFTDDANNQGTLTSAATVAIMPQADNAEPAAPIWSADMLVVEYTTVSIGAASADLFSNVGGSAGLHIKSLWSYTLDRDLRLAFEEAVPGAADLTLQVGDLSLEFPAGSSGKSSFKWTGVDVDWEDGQTIAVNIFPTSTMVEPTPNGPATGVPTISGTPQVGETLTADTSPIDDEDGLTNVSYRYQWIAAGTDIDGATGSTYVLTSSEQGQAIQVRVTFTDDRDNEETLTSAATVVVAAAPNRQATGQPTIGGTPQVDQTLTADTSNIADQDGLTHVSYSYRWIAGGTDIDGATGSSYELTSSEQGQTIQVRVTFTDDADHEETLTSTATVEVAAKPNSPATGAPTIGGTPQVDQTLTADTSPIDDEDGLTNVSYRYQWSAGGADIGGATGSTYTLTASEQGQTIQVRVSFTDDANNEETLTSQATVAVAAAPNREATGKPTIGGTPQVGETLTADTANIADEDGLENVSYRYQWISGGTDIDGATGSTYALTSSEQGQIITLRVTFTDDRNNTETLTSVATDGVEAKPVPLTATFSNVPTSHSGSGEFTFDLAFSENLELSYITLRDHAFTEDDHGPVTKAQRKVQGSNQTWTITIEPKGNGAIAITLPATTDCTAAGAICTSDGRKLSNSTSITIPGPE